MNFIWERLCDYQKANTSLVNIIAVVLLVEFVS